MCVHSSSRKELLYFFKFIHVEVEIGFEQAVYSVNEGDTVLVCVRLTGPEVIDSNLGAFAVISTVPGTATRTVHEHINCLSLCHNS